MRIAALLLIAMPSLFAGCSSGPAASEPFDGDAALAFVRGLALDGDAPRFRIPGTPDHAEAAAWLWQTADVAGWEREWRNGTGREYQGLPKGAVAGYASNCAPADYARVANLTFSNLLAVRRAEPASDRLVLLGAHWDSQRYSDQDVNPARRRDPDPGANDGASGVGLLLQLMRHLETTDLDLPFDVGVLFIDGEDGFGDCHPTAGSLLFASKLRSGEVDRFILLDMVGDPGARFPRESRSVQSDSALVVLVWQHGQAGGRPEHFVDASRSVLDDHLSFQMAGVPAIDIIDFARDTPTGFPPQWNTAGDTVDKLSAATLAAVGDALVATLRDPDFEEGWPAAGRSSFTIAT